MTARALGNRLGARMHVSFRNRLTLFFILLVILPVLVVAGVAILSVQRSESSRTDVRLDQAVNERADGLSPGQGRGTGRDHERQGRSGARGGAARRRSGGRHRRLEELAERTMAVRVRLVFPGRRAIEAGTEDAVAPARSARARRRARAPGPDGAVDDQRRGVRPDGRRRHGAGRARDAGRRDPRRHRRGCERPGPAAQRRGRARRPEYKVRGFRTPGFGARP